ncbi:MAG: Hpt domain-containing protein [Alphaproteobacteria bacterium]|nr:Hpt domain-containing protein [Alphaproteobacteria bacterium]
MPVNDELAHLIPSFFAQMTSDAGLMRDAVAAGDWNVLARLAHSARGHCMLFGYQALTPWLRQINLAAKDGAAATLIIETALSAFAAAVALAEENHRV